MLHDAIKAFRAELHLGDNVDNLRSGFPSEVATNSTFPLLSPTHPSRIVWTGVGSPQLNVLFVPKISPDMFFERTCCSHSIREVNISRNKMVSINLHGVRWLCVDCISKKKKDLFCCEGMSV